MASYGYLFVGDLHTHVTEQVLEGRRPWCRALNALIELMGKPFCIMWAETDSTLRKSGIGNIIIGPGKGHQRPCFMVCDSNGEPKGYGFIYYATLEAAELVIEKLDGSLLNGYLVSVCHFKTYKEHQAEQKSNVLQKMDDSDLIRR
uniref:RRM domain-containing protein n=1 Tax=Sinocyclocheilus grahami TaxID=75366 RepID=A0A672N214_SINGR